MSAARRRRKAARHFMLRPLRTWCRRHGVPCRRRPRPVVVKWSMSAAAWEREIRKMAVWRKRMERAGELMLADFVEHSGVFTPERKGELLSAIAAGEFSWRSHV